jgi:hypothetical protein
MILNAYLICLRFTRGSTIKRTIQVGGAVSGRVQSGGATPRTSSVRGSSPRREVTFSIDVKGGEIYQMQDRELDAWRESTEAWFQGERWSQGSMSDMTSVLHQSVSINAKGGDC